MDPIPSLLKTGIFRPRLGQIYVQGDGRIRVDDMKAVLPALCFSAEHLGLGGETGLTGNDIVVKVALWCCYMNTAPTQLCSMVSTDGFGILHRKQVLALVRIIAKGVCLKVVLPYCRS